mgnify:CR=1 FL=1
MTPELIRQRRNKTTALLHQQCTALTVSYEDIDKDYSRIDNLYNGILSLEAILDHMPSLEDVGDVENTIIANVLQYQERTLGLESIDIISLESIRSRLKEVWKMLVKDIGNVMKKVAMWSTSMTRTLPAIRTHANTMLDQAGGLSEIKGEVTLSGQLSYLKSTPSDKLNVTEGVREFMTTLREFLVLDSTTNIANAKTTSSLMKDSPKVYSGENLNVNPDAIKHVEKLLTASGLDKKIDSRTPPPGPWKRAAVIKGISNSNTVTFVYDDKPLLGGRIAVYRYPNMDAANPDALLEHKAVTLTDYVQAATRRIRGSKVGITGIGQTGPMAESKVTALTPDEIVVTCNGVLEMCNMIETFNSQYGEVSKIKEELVKSGNTAMGIVSDDDTDMVRGKVSEMMRHLVVYHNGRVDKPYIPMVNHCINVIRSTLSYCDKSLRLGYDISQ